LKLNKEIKIGIIVAFGVASLIWGVPFLKGSDIFSNQKKFYAVYDRVDGLSASNPVQINGLKIGQISKLSFFPDGSGRVVVTMLVDGTVDIPRNSKAVLVSSDILGSKAIQIELGKSTELAGSRDTLVSSIQLSLAEEVTSQVAPIRQKTENLITSMDSLITVVHSVLNMETRQNLIKTFESIKHTVQTLEHATVNVDTLVSSQKNRIREIFANVESISQNLKTNNERISGILKNFSSISDTLVKANLAATIENTNKTLKQASEIFTKVNEGKGSMGLLFNNDSLYNGLSASAESLNRLMIDLKENPGRYVHLSLFGGGSKKSDKKN
jgi:phospholipid/cholesterol/gamma-HCH transport system substrate-binding protein